MALNDQWAKFLARPGARSTDPEFNPPKIRTVAASVAPKELKIEVPPQTKPEAVAPELFNVGGIVVQDHLPLFGEFKHSDHVFPPEHLRRVKEAMKNVGITAQEAAKSLSSFGDAMTSVSTNGSSSTLTSAHLEKMRKMIEENAISPTQKMVLTGRQMGKSTMMMDLAEQAARNGKSVMIVKPPEIGGLKADMVILDELHSLYDVNILPIKELEEMLKDGISETTKAGLQQLAHEIEEFFKASSGKVTLSGPEALTVLTNAGYKKKPHIGGEEFKPKGVYLGKKGALIATFEPVEKEAYTLVEMPVTDALQRMDGFSALLEISCDGGYNSRMTEIRNGIFAEKEAQQLQEKADVYADLGFGSW